LTLIVAHRGASLEAPENTLAAFEKAIEIGADMIEFDVRRAPTGVLVVSHDPVQDAKGLPTLEQTLRITKGRIKLDVELKEPGCERDAIELLVRHFPLSDFFITSFLPGVIHTTRALDARPRTGLIFARWDEEIRRYDADILVPHYHLLHEAEQIGKPMFVWTVDDPARIRRLLDHPLVEAIVTNDPRQALALRSESHSH
jgi:glycerophosphoryl diester phosphodiesterase